MASDDESSPGPTLTVVLVTHHWGPAERAWLRSWGAEDGVEPVVVDRSEGREVAEQAQGVRVVVPPRGPLCIALNDALEQVHTPDVLFVAAPRPPLPGLVAALDTLRRPRGSVVIGPSAPPAGIARTALDTLMLHLVPADAVLGAPARWSLVPDAFWVVFPTELLRRSGGFDAAEPHLDLALQDACLRLGRLVRPTIAGQLAWPIERQSVQDLGDAIRRLTAARIRRLLRQPDTPIEPGWALASLSALRSALQRDPDGPDRQRLVEQLAPIDVRPLAQLPEWNDVARDLLRRLMVALRQQQQRWVLEGLHNVLVELQTDSIPALLARHPIRLGRGSTVVMPVERDDAHGVLGAVAAFFRGSFSTRCTLAVVCGPSTGGRLRRSLGVEWQSLKLMAALSGSELLLHATALSAPRALRILAAASAWVPVPRLQGEAWSLHARVCGTRSITLSQSVPWPLDAGRPVRLLGWPRWTDPRALQQFVDELLVPLSGRTDVCVVLRHDAEHDGDLKSAQAQLEAAVASRVQEDAGIEILLLTEALPLERARQVGLSVHAWMGPSGPVPLEQQVGAPVVSRPQEVLDVWDSLRAPPADGPTIPE